MLGDKIPNTHLTKLPGTGGIGTTVFTVGGCMIMIAAAGFYFASRKKENRQEKTYKQRMAPGIQKEFPESLKKERKKRRIEWQGELG